MKERVVSAAILFAMAMALASEAAHSTWIGKSKTKNWAAARNWKNGIPSSFSDSVLFRDTSRVDVTLNMGFTLGSGQTMSANVTRGHLVFRVGDLGDGGELRFAAGSRLDFDKGGFITEGGTSGQKVVIEPGATLSAMRYYANDSFVTLFEAGSSGVTTFYTTDPSGACSLRTSGMLVVDLTDYTDGVGDLVLFGYTKKTKDAFSSVTVKDASGELVEGVDYTLDYAKELGDGHFGVVVTIISKPETLGLIV